ncbi:MAG: hypothetical protein JNK60_18510, partial [Acidobacteria bacterium]|nr:hypothetical protein [Acidobacteriota bacterium]
MFQLRVSIGAAIVVLYALGAGAAPPRAPKAMPTPAPEAVNPDEPPNDEVVKLLMDPNARGTGPAFSAARAVALARGDDRKWHQLLRREALSA